MARGGGGGDGDAAAGTWTKPVCSKFAPFMYKGILVCTIYVIWFAQSLTKVCSGKLWFAHCNQFARFTLSKLLGVLVYPKFTQIYTVCMDFTPILHIVYVLTRVFSGKIPGLLNVQTQCEF